VTWYVRRGHGPRIRIKAEYGSEAFWAEYRAALEGAPLPSKTAKAHTLAWALARYRNSSAWAGMSTATRKQRENIYRAVITTAGTSLVRDITSETIRAGRERRAATPHSANNFLKAMRGFFSWAVEDKLVTVDPTKGVKMLAGPNDADGFHTWSQEELDRYEARWPPGTRERLAFDLLLYTGLRRGDAVRVGLQHVRDGVITIRTEKHRMGKAGEQVTIPILEPLAASIAATKTGDLTYLVTQAGQPWVRKALGRGSGKRAVRRAAPARHTACARLAPLAPPSAARASDNSWRFSDGRRARWLSTTRALPTAHALHTTLRNCCYRQHSPRTKSSRT
jgi:integrase